MNTATFFVTGGALRADADCYVARSADSELLDVLRRGEFSYVLTSRQMGKSSLMVRAAVQLRAEGNAVVILDLTAIGQNLDVDQWYFSMLCHIGEKLNLEAEMEAYWTENERQAPLHRFFGAIRDVYLDRKKKPLVIFVDEIDAVRSLRRFSADEFFAGIRECYNRRPEDRRLERLTFCLLGVATPSDLIQDQRITPFNIGRAIELRDFTRTDADVLGAGLSSYEATAALLLDRVLWWTSGQPYLTQKLCAAVAQAGARTAQEVDQICERIFLSPEARERDDNLHFVRDRILRSELERAALLDAYAKVYRGERVTDDRLNPVVSELRLSGIVRVENGILRPRNQIYSNVFDRKWIVANLPEAEKLRQRAAYYRGVRRVAGAAVLVLGIFGILAFQAWRNAKAAQRNARTAQEATEREQKADRDLLREAERTKNALDHFVATQSKVEGLLGALTPLVGEKSGKVILDRAEEVVRSVTSNEADDPRVVLGLAGLKRVCGQLYLRLGNEEAAIKQADEARRLVDAQVKAGNPDPALKKQLHDCIVLTGDAILGGRTPETGDLKTDADYLRAIATYGEAVELARNETVTRPEDNGWRDLYFGDLINLGDTAQLFGERKAKDAESYYKDALKAVSQLRERTPNSTDLNGIEASIHDRLGTVFLGSGRQTEARAQIDLSLKLRQSGANEELAQKPEQLSGLATSYNKLGNIFNQQGHWKEALDYYERSLDIRRKLCEQDKRRDWQRDLGFSLHNVSLVTWKLGENLKNAPMKAQAIALSQERLRRAEALRAEDPSEPNLKLDHANAIYAYADLLLNVSDNNLKDWPRALELAQEAVAVSDRQDPWPLALLAQALRLAKRAPEARQVAEEAAKLLPPVEKRTADEKEIAKDITHELQKDGSAGTEAEPSRGRRR